MRLFRVYVDGSLFYHPQLSKLAITKAQVDEDAESVDCLTLSAPYNHPYLNYIQPMASVILCKRGDQVVFEGRALDDGSDFYNSHTWKCESCLAYLKDSLQKPYSYKGSLRGLLEYFISEHNRNVEEQKHFAVGNVTVTDSNDYVSYSCSEYTITLEEIRKKLIETHGGYLRVRYTQTGKVLDYLADFSEVSLQKVQYGVNLLDVKINTDHTERVTALIPLGAKITRTDEEGNEVETEERVTIEAANGGKNYVFDEKAVKEIGWIWTTEVWEDVTLASNLLKKANVRMGELAKGITSMELTIVDESDAGADIADIHAREYVNCLSPPHGIDGKYLCISKSKDYMNPVGNTITIGASGIKLTSITAKQDSNLESLGKDISDQNSKLDDLDGKVGEISQAKMYRIETFVDGVNIFKDKGQFSIVRCRVYSWDKEITETVEASKFFWHRKSGNEEADIDWDNSHAGMKQITVTTEDVTDNASFFCEVIL